MQVSSGALSFREAHSIVCQRVQDAIDVPEKAGKSTGLYDENRLMDPPQKEDFVFIALWVFSRSSLMLTTFDFGTFVAFILGRETYRFKKTGPGITYSFTDKAALYSGNE